MTLTILVSSKLQAWVQNQAYLKIITLDFSPILVSLVYKRDTILFKRHDETFHILKVKALVSGPVSIYGG